MRTRLHKVKSNVPGLGGLFIIYQGSALTEFEGRRGLHHLAEHLQTHAYDNISKELQAAGITSNAYTSDNHVAYYWHGLDRKIEQYQKELLELVKYIPTREQFEVEQKIVLQEYKEYVSDASFLYSNIQRKYFDYYGPIGYSKDIENIDYETFLEFYVRAFLRPTSIIRIGDSETIDADTKDFQYNKLKTNETITLKTNPTNEFVEANSSFPDSKSIVDWVPTTSDISYKNLYLITKMWSEDLSSPLYQEIREKKGLVYYVQLHAEMFSEDVGMVSFHAGCAPDKDVEVRETFQNTLQNFEEHFTKERFDIVVESLKCKDEMSKILNYTNISQFITYDWELIDLEYLNNITFEEIYEDNKKFVAWFKNCNHASQSTEAIV